MAIIAGNLRYTIIVKRLTDTKDSYGAVTSVYNTVMTLKAAKKIQKGTLTSNNFEIFNTNTITFITYFRDIRTTDQIEFENQLYKIVGYPVEIGFREGQEITVELINV